MNNLFKKNERIKIKSDFDKLFKLHNKLFSENFILFYCENNLTNTRIAISIKKRIANSPKRNRMKRLVRESFRLNKNIFEKSNQNKNFDILIIAKQDFSKNFLQDIQKELLDLWRKFV